MNPFHSYSYDVTHTLQYNMAPSFTPAQFTKENTHNDKRPVKQNSESKLQTLLDDASKEAFVESDKSQCNKEMKERDGGSSDKSDPSKSSTGDDTLHTDQREGKC